MRKHKQTISRKMKFAAQQNWFYTALMSAARLKK